MHVYTISRIIDNVFRAGSSFFRWISGGVPWISVSFWSWLMKGLTGWSLCEGNGEVYTIEEAWKEIDKI